MTDTIRTVISGSSACCGAIVKIGTRETGEHYYICTACGKPCKRIADNKNDYMQ
jgi:hypothetical protein